MTRSGDLCDRMEGPAPLLRSAEHDGSEVGQGDWDADLVSLVERHPMFEGMDSGRLWTLLGRCWIRELRVGEILLAPEQVNRHPHLLLDGQLRVHIDRLDSPESILIEAGECTGEISVIDCRPATAFVIASAPSRILLIPEGTLWEDLLATPRIARSFMRLFADRLRARTAVIQHALEQRLRYEHMQRELGIARDIQLGMLPTHLDLGPEIDIAARMTPAQEVGGDFYDVFPVGPDEHCIAIGSPIPSPRPSSPSRMGHRGQTTSPWWCSGMSGISRWPG